MNISIKASDIELTSEISDYVNKKIGSLDKYFKNKSPDIIVRVEVGKVTNHHQSGDIFRAEVHISGDGLDLYAVSENDNILSAIDAVKDEIKREIKRAKGRNNTLSRKGGEAIKNMMKGFSWTAGKLKIKGLKKRK